MGFLQIGTGGATSVLAKNTQDGGILMGTGTLILLIVLIILLLGTAPTWPHSRSWGYAPSGGIGLVLVILLLLYFLGYLNF
jgi:hypothetical protein